MLLQLRTFLLFLVLTPANLLLARKLESSENVNFQASQEQEKFKIKYGALIEKRKEEERLVFENARNAIEELGKSLQEHIQQECEKERVELARVNALSNQDFALFISPKLIKIEQLLAEIPVIQILEEIVEVGNLKNISYEDARLFFSMQQDALREYPQILGNNQNELEFLSKFFEERALDEQKVDAPFRLLQQKCDLLSKKANEYSAAVTSAQRYLADKKSRNNLTTVDEITGTLLLLRSIFS